MHESIEAIQVLERDSNVPVRPLNLSNNGSWTYISDSPMIGSLGNLNLVTASTLKVPLATQNRNISYSTAFSGPAWQCIEANETVASYVTPAIIDYRSSTNRTILWASWIPTPPFGPGMNGSFFDSVLATGDQTSALGFEYPNDRPQIYHVKYFPTNSTTRPDGSPNALFEYRVIECTLHNATYDVRFDLKSNGNQAITTNRTLLDVLSLAKVLPNTTFPADQAIERFNDIAFVQMYALYIADGLVADKGTAAFLMNSPTLGRAVRLPPFERLSPFWWRFWYFYFNNGTY